MKRHAKMIAAIVLAAVLSLCAGYMIGHEQGRNAQPDVIYAPTFYATVTEVGESWMAVEGLEINQINYRSLYEFSVTEDTQLVWRGTPAALTEFRPGLTVAVTYAGYVLETYPAGLTEVVRVEVLDDEFR